jgi:hypothetical protein
MGKRSEAEDWEYTRGYITGKQSDEAAERVAEGGYMPKHARGKHEDTRDEMETENIKDRANVGGYTTGKQSRPGQRISRGGESHLDDCRRRQQAKVGCTPKYKKH